MTPLDLSVPSSLMLAIVPELVLMGGAMLILLWAGWKKDSDAHQRNIGAASLVLVALTIGAVVWSMSRVTSVLPGGPVTADNFRWAMDIVILLGAGLTIMLSMDDNRREMVHAPETHVLVLLASAGMMLLPRRRT
jgi:NADH-quinone oxidoreductase subunit N